MKKTTITRLIAIALALVMVLAAFVGCGDREALKEAYTEDTQQTGAASTNTGDETNKDSSSQIAEIQTEIDRLNADLEKANASMKEFEEQITGLEAKATELEAQKNELETQKSKLEAQKNELEAQKNELETQKSKLETQKNELEIQKNELESQNKELNEVANAEKNALLATLEAEKAAWESEKAALLEQIARLEAQIEPKVEVINNTIYADLDYVLEQLIFVFKDGTAALKATTKGIPVIVDYREAIGSKTNYRDNTVMLPRQGYNYAVTYDCMNAYTVATGGSNQAYSYASGGLFLGSNLKPGTGYELKETTLRGSFGLTDDLLRSVIVAVEDPSAEYGYSFYVKVDNYAENPVYEPSCKHGTDCHCGDCDKCPALQPETVVKTETVKVCMICGAKDCKGHVETKVETQTITVCKTCGKQNCNGHVATVTVKVCKTCGKQNCNGHVATVTVKVCKTCGKQDCNGHVLKYCGKCEYPWANCICDDEPANNTTNPGKDDLIDDLKGEQANNSTNTGFGSLVDDLQNNQSNSSNNDFQSGTTNNSGNSTNNSGWQTNNNTNTNTNNNTTNTGFAGLVGSLTP